MALDGKMLEMAKRVARFRFRGLAVDVPEVMDYVPLIQVSMAARDAELVGRTRFPMTVPVSAVATVRSDDSGCASITAKRREM